MHKNLLQLAISFGASDARWIRSRDILVEEHLVRLCQSPRCPYYAMAPGCPPHVSGPTGFRRLRRELQKALVVRLEVPRAELFSAEQQAVMRKLHQIVAGVEREALHTGYAASRAFAGGSCKAVFCHDYPDCPVLSENGSCRFPKYARPSMSGFGINVAELMKTCGWSEYQCGHPPDAGGTIPAEQMSWLAGLVLMG